MSTKDCYCHTCQREFNHMGIAKHRATHRNKKENCRITYSNGDTWTHAFGEKKATTGQM